MTPIRARIDLGALRHNLATLRARAPSSRVVGVVKADAYGHGAVPVARALASEVDMFAVARLDEALELREAGLSAPLMVLEGVFSAHEQAAAIRAGIELVVHDPEQLRLLEQSPPPAGSVVWLKFDTGMHRLGLEPATAAAVWRRVQTAVPAVQLRLMTHLACADESDHPLTRLQLDTFAQVHSLVTQMQGGLAPQTSIGNSAGLLDEPRARSDWVRPGLALYGSSPFAQRSAASLGLRPVMTLETRVLALQSVVAGESVGYGASWRAVRDTRIAIAGAGYADGVPRNLPSGTPVLAAPRAHGALRGSQRGSQPESFAVPIVGRVSMDLIALDVTDVPALAIGDRIVLWGEGAPVDALAAAAGTLAYELWCRVAPRVPRVYT